MSFDIFSHLPDAKLASKKTSALARCGAVRGRLRLDSESGCGILWVLLRDDARK